VLIIGRKNAQKHKKRQKKIKREGQVTRDKGREKTVRPQISQHFINPSISADPVRRQKIQKKLSTKNTKHTNKNTNSSIAGRHINFSAAQ